MSRSNNRSGARRRQAGFTLAELLVAMVIFLTVMAGVTALFAGTIDTVHQGYRALDAYELARGSLAVMERDLQTAFASREQGGLYYFHGPPNGFAFVGMLPNGQLGRVAYAVHPSARAKQFRTIMALPWEEVLNNVRRQAEDQANTLGADPDATGAAAENFLRTIYAAEMPSDPAFPVDFPVVVNTSSLIRFEETNVGDLNSLKLPALPGGGTPEWRYIAPEDPAGDDISDIAGTEPGSADGDSWSLYLHTISKSVNPDVNLAAGTVNYANDLRVVMEDVRYGSPDQLFALRPALVERLINARRYEVWMRMFAWNEQDLTQVNLPTFWRDKNINDYIVAEQIVANAVLLDPNTQQPIGFNRATAQPVLYNPGNPAHMPFDALYVPSFFLYSNNTENFRDSYNAIANVRPEFQGNETWLSDYMDAPGPNTLLNFDTTLAQYASGPGLANASMGTPLEPSIPVSVTARFWIMMEKPRPGAGDFRQWFAQTIEIPSGARRDPASSAAPAPGRI